MIMSRKEILKNNTEKCHAKIIKKQGVDEIEFSCQSCDIKFDRNHSSKHHEKKPHKVNTCVVPMLINNSDGTKIEDFFC